ncbi:YbhB/YbcL family Raf kinase inhibitor-like protein [Solitalea lacus]|uniref:YbhB/YbcL family Raf kinase inhibitor-like protein n=1 Tax=Solitalea lacus TaxID=2911172 RepID=UPI001EDC0ED1|nr:YbhB/YbcL family Raf kinase inhibitor-like protein [Solitalea lacus]UKJ08701.1 YbhB/YbcL family Raf kinase inhibitor-like protein [Solitalea lacus]
MNVAVKMALAVSSRVIKQGGMIPEKYTCEGINVNPPLTIKEIPENAQCLVLIVDDPDAPMGTWNHWLVWNIDTDEEIKENSIPGIEGINDFRQHHYGGPCPPSGTHRYFFKVYALNKLLKLKADSRKESLLEAMENHIVAYGELMGTYKRQ